MDSGVAFQAKLEVGRFWERAVAQWLMNKGFRVLPVYDYSGLNEDKAPKLTALRHAESLIVPDLFVTRRGKGTFVEVKFKTRADYTRITKRQETGISRKLWEHYQAVQMDSGLDVWLLFVHQQEGEVRGEALATLLNREPRIYDGDKMGHWGMVFFDYARLRRLATLAELQADPALATETARRGL